MIKLEDYTKETDKSKLKIKGEDLKVSGIGKLNLEVPKTRIRDFRPSILPPLYSRTDSSYSSLLKALIESGYSDSAFENFYENMGLLFINLFSNLKT